MIGFRHTYFLFPAPIKPELSRRGSFNLPACLLYAGDFALVSQLSEADTANAVIAEIGVGTAAYFAAVIAASRELRLCLLL